MTQLQRLVLDYRGAKLIIRALYKTEDGPSPNTKVHRREVTDLTCECLRQALASLEGEVELVGTSGYQVREDIIVASAPPAGLETGQQVNTKLKEA